MKSVIRVVPVSGEVDPQVSVGSKGASRDDVPSPTVRLDLVAKSVRKNKIELGITFPPNTLYPKAI